MKEAVIIQPIPFIAWETWGYPQTAASGHKMAYELEVPLNMS